MRKYVARCNHCKIFFFTEAQNSGRKDLRCKFGCASVHRKKEAIRRSIEYYKTEEGKKQKKKQNRKRTDKNLPSPCTPEPIVEETYQIDNRNVTAEMIYYLSQIASLIEKERITVFAILSMLRKKVRQRRMLQTKKSEYIANYLNNKPP